MKDARTKLTVYRDQTFLILSLSTLLSSQIAGRAVQEAFMCQSRAEIDESSILAPDFGHRACFLFRAVMRPVTLTSLHAPYRSANKGSRILLYQCQCRTKFQSPCSPSVDSERERTIHWNHRRDTYCYIRHASRYV